MKYIFTCIWIIISLPLLFSQNSFLKYYDFKSEYGNIHALCRVGDELMGTGIFWDTFSLPPKQNIILFRSNKDGELINYKYFNDSDAFYLISLYGALYMPNIIPISDELFVTTYTNSLEKELEILMFDMQLNLINRKIVYSAQDYKNVIPINLSYWNNKIILAGVEGKSGNYISYLYKINNNFNIVTKEKINNIHQLRSIDFNYKNGLIFSEFDNGDKYLFTDTLLNEKKNIKLKNGLSDVYHEHIKCTSDGGFLTASYNLNGTQNFSLNIVKRDSLANTIWKFGMGGTPGQMAAVADIIPSSDGAYFAYGQIGIRTSDINDADPGRDSFDIRIFSTVKFRDDGKIIWQRFDTLETGYYNESYAHCGGMVAADDGGLYVSGDVTCYDTVSIDGILKRRTDYKHFLMKIDSNGCVEGLHCNVEPKTETVLSVQPSLPSDAGKMSVYPNPSTGIITVDLSAPVSGRILTLYGLLGDVIVSRPINNNQASIQLDLSGRPSGQYYVSLHKDDGKVIKTSFMIIK